jgi:hypothetical protein
MPIFQGFTDRFRGSVNVILREQVEGDIDRFICQVLEAAIMMWEQDGWMTHNAEEVNHTAQLYRWCKVVCRRDRRFSYLSVNLEWVDVTAAILDGSESVKSANRPDIRIEIGETGRTIECKRLGPKDGWPRKYVYEGLARFVGGNYAHDEAVGYMVGYVQSGTVPGVLRQINQQITNHPNMGMAHQLNLLRDNGISSWCRSSHPRESRQAVRIDHLLADVSRTSAV